VYHRVEEREEYLPGYTSGCLRGVYNGVYLRVVNPSWWVYLRVVNPSWWVYLRVVYNSGVYLRVCV